MKEERLDILFMFFTSSSLSSSISSEKDIVIFFVFTNSLKSKLTPDVNVNPLDLNNSAASSLRALSVLIGMSIVSVVTMDIKN